MAHSGHSDRAVPCPFSGGEVDITRTFRNIRLRLKSRCVFAAKRCSALSDQMFQAVRC